jgi:hypothetical protein
MFGPKKKPPVIIDVWRSLSYRPEYKEPTVSKEMKAVYKLAEDFSSAVYSLRDSENNKDRELFKDLANNSSIYESYGLQDAFNTDPYAGLKLELPKGEKALMAADIFAKIAIRARLENEMKKHLPLKSKNNAVTSALEDRAPNFAKLF